MIISKVYRWRGILYQKCDDVLLLLWGSGATYLYNLWVNLIGIWWLIFVVCKPGCLFVQVDTNTM